MRTGKLLLAGLVAVVALTVAVSPASANNFSVNEDDKRFNFLGFTFEAAGTRVTCEIQLLATLHSRTIRKVPRSLVGHGTSGTVPRCAAGGAATLLQADLPWHLTYLGFVGRLPRPLAMLYLFVNFSFRVENGMLTCLAKTDASEPALLIVNLNESGRATSLRLDESVAIDIDDPGFLCGLAGDVRLSGTAEVTVPGGGAVDFRLI